MKTITRTVVLAACSLATARCAPADEAKVLMDKEATVEPMQFLTHDLSVSEPAKYRLRRRE